MTLTPTHRDSRARGACGWRHARGPRGADDFDRRGRKDWSSGWRARRQANASECPTWTPGSRRSCGRDPRDHGSKLATRDSPQILICLGQLFAPHSGANRRFPARRQRLPGQLKSRRPIEACSTNTSVGVELDGPWRCFRSPSTGASISTRAHTRSTKQSRMGRHGAHARRSALDGWPRLASIHPAAPELAAWPIPMDSSVRRLIMLAPLTGSFAILCVDGGGEDCPHSERFDLSHNMAELLGITYLRRVVSNAAVAATRLRRRPSEAICATELGAIPGGAGKPRSWAPLPGSAGYGHRRGALGLCRRLRSSHAVSRSRRRTG